MSRKILIHVLCFFKLVLRFYLNYYFQLTIWSIFNQYFHDFCIESWMTFHPCSGKNITFNTSEVFIINFGCQTALTIIIARARNMGVFWPYHSRVKRAPMYKYGISYNYLFVLGLYQRFSSLQPRFNFSIRRLAEVICNLG